MITINESNRYAELINLFIENELEFTEKDKQIPGTVAKYWEALDDGKLIGGCVLGLREGVYILEGIATDADYRKKRVGKQLLCEAETYLKTLGARKLYLCAKAPGFFKTQGFLAIDRENAPQFGCINCDQFGIKCFPEVMMKDL
ncbi:MAG: GNAT family N-acetyltransferase [Desulfobacter sp.]|nr:MAG: GNAT family N-acetyltransferase [Desulfobacter sp.]